jgi:hypothetical protein
MRLFDRLARIFGDLHSPPEETGRAATEPDAINPATGLPTVAGAGSPDIAGNPYGVSLAHRHEQDRDYHERCTTGSSFDDHVPYHDSWSSKGAGGGHDPWRH